MQSVDGIHKPWATGPEHGRARSLPSERYAAPDTVTIERRASKRPYFFDGDSGVAFPPRARTDLDSDLKIKRV